MKRNDRDVCYGKQGAARHAGLFVLACVVAAAGQQARAQDWDGDARQAHSWPSWGGNLQNTHTNAAEHKIGRENVSQLKQKWVFTTAGDVSATPTVEGGSVYVPDYGGLIYRIDAATGKAIWSHKVSEYTGNAKSLSRNSPAIAGRAIVIGDQAGATMLSLDKGSGKLLWKTTVDTADGAFITGSPVIAGDVVYVGISSLQEYLVAALPDFKLTFRGSVVALDLYTGKILWKTYTVPQGYTGGPIWSSAPSIDLKRGSVYVTTGNNYDVPPVVDACLKGAGANAVAQLACLAPNDYLESILSLDLGTGKVKWGRRLGGADLYTDACNPASISGAPCPTPTGPDYDFGSGANLFTTTRDGKPLDVVGAGQKSGVYWALDPDTGKVLWGTQVGPGGDEGGIEWGTAADGKLVYTEVNNDLHMPFVLETSKVTANAGSWAALDAATGKVVWQVPASGADPLDPRYASGATGAVTVANGVFYAGALSGDMVALDAATGKTLWTFASGGSVVDGPSIVNGTVYWGSGYGREGGGGTGNNKLYAFSLPKDAEDGH